MEQARKIVEQTKQRSVDLLVRDGTHRSILLGFTPPGEQNLVMDAGNLEPDQRWPALRELLAEAGAIGYILIDEAWAHHPRSDEMRTIAGDEPGLAQTTLKPDVPRPSLHPDRREALLIQWQFKVPGADEWSGGWQRLFRHEGEAIVMEEVVDLPKITGRAAQLLDPEGGEVLPPGFRG
jgi:hypothetical protein